MSTGLRNQNVAGGIRNNSGGKTLPKAGRLGSGSYYPNGSPIKVNPFGPNNESSKLTPVQPPTGGSDRVFGSPSNAGNNTQFGQNRVTSGQTATHPNSHFRDISKQPSVLPFTADGFTQKPQTPFMQATPKGTIQNYTIQPHERNSLLRNKVWQPKFHAAMGTQRNLPTDTAFVRVPPVENPPARRPVQQYTLNLTRQKQTGPSFTSRNNLWYDPNNSFQSGASQTANGTVGKSRWSTVKRGAAG
jgi:hypothetical protein